MTTNILITFAIFAWLLQIIAGWWQIRRFNYAFDQLVQLGRVGIGRSGGRLQPKVVLVVALDRQDTIIKALLIRGYTVIATPKELPHLAGLALNDVQPQQLFPNDLACQKALALAIEPKR